MDFNTSIRKIQCNLATSASSIICNKYGVPIITLMFAHCQLKAIKQRWATEPHVTRLWEGDERNYLPTSTKLPYSWNIYCWTAQQITLPSTCHCFVVVCFPPRNASPAVPLFSVGRSLCSRLYQPPGKWLELTRGRCLPQQLHLLHGPGQDTVQCQQCLVEHSQHQPQHAKHTTAIIFPCRTSLHPCQKSLIFTAHPLY